MEVKQANFIAEYDSTWINLMRGYKVSNTACLLVFFLVWWLVGFACFLNLKHLDKSIFQFYTTFLSGKMLATAKFISYLFHFLLSRFVYLVSFFLEMH